MMKQAQGKYWLQKMRMCFQAKYSYGYLNINYVFTYNLVDN